MSIHGSAVCPFKAQSRQTCQRKLQSHYRLGNNTTLWRCPPLGCLASLWVVAEAACHQSCHYLLVTNSDDCVRFVGVVVKLPTRLVLELVISKLDYCNSVFAGLPTSTLNVFQKVQNAAERLIYQPRPRDYVSSSLQELRGDVRYSESSIVRRFGLGG